MRKSLRKRVSLGDRTERALGERALGDLAPADRAPDDRALGERAPGEPPESGLDARESRSAIGQYQYTAADDVPLRV